MYKLYKLKKLSLGLLTGVVFSTAFASSAFALDSKAFIQDLQDKIQSYGLIITYDNDPKIDNESIILDDVRFVQKDKTTPPSPVFPIELGTTKFENIKTENDGSFTIGKLTAGQKIDTNSKQPEQVALKGIELEDMHLGEKDKTYPLDKYLPYKKATIDNISYTLDGKTILSLKKLESEYEKEDNNLFKNTGSVESFVFDPSFLTDPRGKDIKDLLNSLGYTKIKGSFGSSSHWNAEQGNFDVTKYQLNADDIGSINISGKLEGMTQYFVNNYEQLMLRSANTQNASPKEQDKLNQDILALISQLQLDNLAVKYNDNSLVNRILDYLSQSSQSTRDQIIEVAKANVKRATQNLQDKNFANKVNDELNTFINDPKSLEITARPQQAAAFSSILVVMRLSPEQLINLLKIDVVANK